MDTPPLKPGGDKWLDRLPLREPGEVLSVLTLVGLFVYSMTWFTYRGVYEQFGLSAADVGLSYTEMLTSAALGSILIVTVALLVLNVVALMMYSEGDLGSDLIHSLLPEDAPAPLKLAATYGWVLFVLGSIAMIRPVMWATGRVLDFLPNVSLAWLNTIITWSVGILLFLFLWALSLNFALAALYGVSKSIKRLLRAEHALTLTIGLSITVLLGALIFGPYVLGQRIGAQVAEGNTGGLLNAQPVRWLFNIQADRVDIEWLGDKGTCAGLPTHEILYLGGVNGTVILYDPETRAVCRTPTGSLQMTSRQ